MSHLDSRPSLPLDWKAALFDFDGTLIDSYPAITASVNFVRGKRGLDPVSEQTVRENVGHGATYLLTHTVPGTDVEESLRLYHVHHPTIMVEKTRLLPGASELLTKLKAAGKLVGLCSNKPRAFSDELLAAIGWVNHFDIVLGPEDVANRKPAPDMLIEAMKRLDVSVEQTLYVGDMSVDIQTGRGAGVPVWVVPTGSETIEQIQEAQPDHLLNDLHDLVAML
ncbi:MAG: HAD family hydrolase [Gemmataceae bacterium]